MRPAEKYRSYAAHCVQKALADVGLADDGALLLEMAAEWERLADREENGEVLKSGCEVGFAPEGKVVTIRLR
jgi:hypothetical protein